jgi:carbon-monoxide dehydrogenase large subunit
MDYAMPRADDMPLLSIGFNSTRCTTNPLGVKGSGEPGAIAAYPAIANAIYDALAPFGASHVEGPATPERIWRAIQQGKRT